MKIESFVKIVFQNLHVTTVVTVYKQIKPERLLLCLNFDAEISGICIQV